MFKKLILFVLITLISFSASAECNASHGPFKISESSNIYIKEENNINYPLGLYFETKKVITKVDRFETNGSQPNIDTVFFMKINDVKNALILVSWKQTHSAENISGTLYQIYGYQLVNGELKPNKLIINDPEMSGQDGLFYGEKLYFKYKNAKSIRSYINSKYN